MKIYTVPGLIVCVAIGALSVCALSGVALLIKLAAT